MGGGDGGGSVRGEFEFVTDSNNTITPPPVYEVADDTFDIKRGTHRLVIRFFGGSVGGGMFE